MVTAAATTASGAPAERAVRADAVLPAELVRQIQRHTDGRYIYVPSVTTEMRRARDERLLALRADGVTVREIAQRLGLTERRVYQVIARDRQDSQPCPR